MKWFILNIHPGLSALLVCLTLTTALAQAEAPVLTLPLLLQQTLKNYPSLQSAALQVTKAQQASTQIKAQLGWQFAAQFGINRDVSFFGLPVNRVNIGTQLTRQLASGDALTLSAAINRDDASAASLPTLPNPATSSVIEVQYRTPLAQGSDNSTYTSALTQATGNLDIQRARQQQGYDQLATQLIDLFSATLTTQQRIRTIEQSIHRSQRLQRFIHQRIDLGIAEDKDRLQTRAQLNGLQAQQQALKLIQTQQTIALNRLLGRPWQSPITLSGNSAKDKPGQLTTLLAQARQHSPALKINAARQAIAISRIKRQRDQGRDRLDLILSIGNRNLRGDSNSGRINDSELVAGVQLEYGQALDQSGNKAALYQAQLERNISLHDQKQIEIDLHYTVATRLAELTAIQSTIQAYQRSVRSEHAKLDEAEQRYRRGRITIDQVIRFESQTATNELELALQQIDYQRRHDQFTLLLGTLWQTIDLPDAIALHPGTQP